MRTNLSMSIEPSRPWNWPRLPHVHRAQSRREFLLRAGGGFGALALSYLLRNDSLFAGASAGKSTASLDPKEPHFPAKARSVIFLFMEGGPSHLDLFDYKPKLNEMAGKPLPPSFG